MARYSANLDDQYGRPVGASVLISLSSNPSILGTLVADDGSALSNPLAIGPDGAIIFNVTDGLYDFAYFVSGRRVGRDLNIIIGVASTLPTGSVFNALGSATTVAPSQAAVTTGLASKADLDSTAALAGADFTGHIGSPNLWTAQAPDATIGGRIPFDRTAAPVAGALAVPDRTTFPLAFVQGTGAAPITTDAYLRPAFYLERHVAGKLSYEQSPDSNGLLAPTLHVQTFLEAGSSNAASGIHSKVTSATTAGADPTSTDSTFGQAGVNASSNLVCAFTGTVALAAPAGQANRSGWGANLEVLWNSGNAPGNAVGIEIDLCNSGGQLNGGVAGIPSPNNNFTGLWVQTAPRNASAGTPYYATSAIYISDAGGAGMGYQNGIVAVSHFQHMGLTMSNQLNAMGAGGIGVDISRANDDAQILGLSAAGAYNFVVSGDPTNPVLARVGGTLRRVMSKTQSTLAGTDIVLVAV